MINFIKRFIHSETGTIFLASLLSWLLAIQMLIVIVLAAGFFKIDTTSLNHIFTTRFAEVHVERESEFFRVCIILSFFIQAGMLWYVRRRLDSQEVRQKILFRIGLSVFWIVTQLFFVFKIIVHQNPDWARMSFYCALIAAILSQCLANRIRSVLLPWILARLSNPFDKTSWTVVYVLFGVFIFSLIHIHDSKQALAIIFAHDHFDKLDAMIMAPGWSFLNGGILNVTQISPMGPILVMVVAGLSKLTGAFDYARVIHVLTVISVIYYLVFFVFIRHWLESRTIAMAATLFLIKLHMFNVGVAPIIWADPASTVLRHAFDVGFLWMLYRHICKPTNIDLLGVIVLCGASLAVTPDVGICLWVVLCLYLIKLAVHSFDFHTLRRSLLLGAAPFILLFIIHLMLQGRYVFSLGYWSEYGSYLDQLFLGWGQIPVAQTLNQRQFFAFFMGLCIPLFYVLTVIFLGILALLKRLPKEKFFIIFVAIYGLGMYQEYVLRSELARFYIFSFPLVVVMCFWVKEIFLVTQWLQRPLIRFLFVVVAALSLLTNTWFVLYPNIFKTSAKSWEQEIKYYQDEFQFHEDVKFIQRMTSVDQKVALISSFETALLMAADRQSIFYDAPLFVSSPLRFNHFAGTHLIFRDRFNRTIQRLEDQKPAKIFIERKIFYGQIAQQFYQQYTAMTSLVVYLRENYEMEEDGQYLIALKLKSQAGDTQ